MIDTNELCELSDLVEQLNSQIYTIDDAIRKLTAWLRSTNGQLGYWLDTPLESTGMLQNTRYFPPMRYRVDTYLGYDRIGQAWELALKIQHTEFEWDSEVESEVRQVRYIPLLSASRQLRLAALAQFDQLIAGIKLDMEGKLRQLRNAETLAAL